MVDPSGNIHIRWNFKAIWNANREAFVNAGIAFVTSGFNPVAAVAAFGSTEFTQSKGGEHLIGQFANILGKNNIMGERESLMFSRFLVSTLTSMAIETGMGQLMADPAVGKQSYIGDPKNVQGGGDVLGTNPLSIYNKSYYFPDKYSPGDYRTIMLTGSRGQQAFLSTQPFNENIFAEAINFQHSSSISINLVTGTTSNSDFSAVQYFLGRTCHQYSNANLLRAGFSDTVTSIGAVGWSGYLSYAFEGIYGGQLWPKIITIAK